MCFHSEGRETRQFHRLMETLSADWRLIAFDMPAHGKTWPVEGKYPMSAWDSYVDFAWQFLQATGTENAVLMGCGMGAATAMALALRHGAGALITIGAAADFTDEIDLDLINHPYISTPHMVLEYNKSLIGSRADAEAAELITWQAWCEAGITLKEDLRMLSSLDFTAELGSLGCPVLMFRGQDDWTVSHEQAAAMLELLGSREKKLVELEGAGKFVMIEQPAAMAESIRDFFHDTINDQGEN